MLTNYISGIEDKWTKALKLKVIKASIKNPWFTKENIDLSLKYWSENLTEEKLHTWLSKYEINTKQPKTIAVVMAGNFPLAGFHDFLCVLITGNNLLIKFSNNDEVLLKFIIEYLTEIDSSFKDNINIRESIIKTFDKVIATGSNNTSRYFDYYFKDKPSIIRKNRFSIGILTGKENRNDLEKLSNDIFTFFGLGCRNVSKIFVPKNYNFDKFFKSVYKWRNIINNYKYASNYNYNRAINLIDIQPILENGFLILKESKNNYSPISVLLYEYYNDTNELKGKIELIKDDLQCIVSKNYYKNGVAFGEAQNPTLYDYADNIDTIEFLLTK